MIQNNEVNRIAKVRKIQNLLYDLRRSKNQRYDQSDREKQSRPADYIEDIGSSLKIKPAPIESREMFTSPRFVSDS
jgi:hypothetical protein